MSYITCTLCKKGCENIDTTVKLVFGYRADGSHFKLCVNCRNRRKEWRQSKPKKQPRTEYCDEYGNLHFKCSCCANSCADE
eukprot:9553470-Prorocentrum_lima.AAC.1